MEDKRSWNFFVSLTLELLVLSVALVIPLIYSDHLPEFRWKDIIVGPPPTPAPVLAQPTHASGQASSTPSRAPYRPFVWSPTVVSRPAQPTGDFVPDAPPSIITNLRAGNNNDLGNLIPNTIAAAPPPKPAPDVQKPLSAPIRVGEGVQMAKLLRKVVPEYPPIARANRISGVVRLVGIIGKDGTIQNLQLVSGHPLLAHAALEAVRQWIYKPTLLNGTPVEVMAPIEVNFTLAQ